MCLSLSLSPPLSLCLSHPLSLSLSRVLMWRYTNIPGWVEAGGRKEKRCSLSQMCLEGLLRIFTTCTQRHPERTARLLSAMSTGGARARTLSPQMPSQIPGNYWRY